MLFNSIEFVVLALSTFFLYYLPWVRRAQVMLLILSSWVFYGWNNPALLILLFLSAFLNSSLAYLITHNHNPYKRRAIATTGVVANLSLLVFFKYSGLLGSLFFDPTDSIGAFLVSIPLPIGISFYTFQGISLLIDVYREGPETPIQSRLIPNNYSKTLTHEIFYISFFPHLVAGPIMKAHDFLPQIGGKKWKDIRWDLAFKTLVVGYFLKLVVADNLAEFTQELSFPSISLKNGGVLLSLLLGYSIQIFADFAGYSLIAMGLCYLFGYRLMQNFNFPYISASITEFWRRWHISLSTWLREYLYLPLGGNRKGAVRTYINLLVVMLLGGLWHGAAWSYMVWGGYHGLLLVIERLGSRYVQVPNHGIVRFFRILAVFVIVTFGWLLFKLNDFSHVILYFEQLANAGVHLADFKAPLVYNILFYTLPILCYHLLYLWAKRSERNRDKLEKYAYILYGILLFFIALSPGLKADFIYFQF